MTNCITMELAMHRRRQPIGVSSVFSLPLPPFFHRKFMSFPLVKFEKVTFRKYRHIVFPDTDWEMCAGENWAVAGAGGSGKTTFLEAAEGRLMKINGRAEYCFKNADGTVASDPQSQIASVYFGDRSVNYGDFYYQQRYHATETDGIVTVREFLGSNVDDARSDIRALHIGRLLDTEIIKLSNGQFKKMLIVKALLKKPRLLLLDNLFTGLDAEARDYIADTLERVIGGGTQIIMTVDNAPIPAIIDRVMEVDRFSVKRTLLRKDYAAPSAIPDRYPELPDLPQAPEKTFETAIRLDEVTVAYGGNNVIDRANWTVGQGEKWALTGPNGAGKSMLLSLIFADNPQAYANRIVLFDRKRGTGESIWDIKDRIGFVSPELHVYFRQSKTCREVALSGLSENPYRRTVISDGIRRFTDDLFAYFSITPVADELFQRASTGRQNIVLLIRALVKNPSMLILDEPFQGLDEHTIAVANRLLNEYCKDRTLIFVSHRPEEFPACIGRYLYIENGRTSER